MSDAAIRLLPNGDPKEGMIPCVLVDAKDFLGDDQTEIGHTFYANAQGNVTAGVWECSPCLEKIERYGVDEICTVLSGSVTVTGEDGIAHTFGPGDSFVMPQDFKGTWHITETLKKFYMIAEPPSDT